MRLRLRLSRSVTSSSEIHISFSLNHVDGHQIVVISEEEAADTGSLLTHFICLALSLLTIKQMEKNCMIHAWRPHQLLSLRRPPGSDSLSGRRSEASGRRGLHDA